jgi:hypothetical protein
VVFLQSVTSKDKKLQAIVQTALSRLSNVMGPEADTEADEPQAAPVTVVE